MNIKINLNWQISFDKEHSIDPILFSLLQSVEELGSLKRATEKVNVSYRFAWGLLGKWEKALQQPLVILERGRGAHLSVIGEKLLKAHLQLQARFSPDLDNFATQFKQEFESLLIQDKQTSLNIFASHGLAIGSLRDLINQQTDFKLDLHFHGSLESLQALTQGSCDIAGFHIPAGDITKQLSPQYLSLINSQQHQLIYVVKRNQGLMVQASNPKKIRGVKSLTNNKVQFINRQSGSGTRLLFDQLLAADNINAEQINGYQHEEFTHMAVAAMIASGVADVGLGISAMAEKFNLEFIPLIWEHYCLAVPKTILNDGRVSKIIALLQSDAYQHSLSNSTGYDSSQSGQLVNFNSIFD
ncbi:LysR family transcriptional regulator [Methylophaga sp. 41_12_T18]|nr:LysR family transcriptional regulator [Methylophaga sp. 41_12_T18]